MRNRRLHANAHETVGVIDRQPGMGRQLGLPRLSVLPKSRTSILAPAATSTLTTSVAPLCAAPCSATRPVSAWKLGSMPSDSKYFTASHRLLGRALLGDAFHPADAGSRRQRRHAQLGIDLRIGATREQQLHQFKIA